MMLVKEVNEEIRKNSKIVNVIVPNFIANE
jgi:hypothetical protein